MQKLKKYNLCNKEISCNSCPLVITCGMWASFVETHSGVKKYAHFDRRACLSFLSVCEYVQNTKKIESHSFYPLIHYRQLYSKYGKNSSKKERDIYYCSHLDRCVYQRYAFLLNQKYDTWVRAHDINDVSVAYRDNLGKTNIDLVKDALGIINRHQSCFIMVGDFTDFFDNINHQYLKKMMCKLLEKDELPADYYAVFKNITKFASWDWESVVNASGHSIYERMLRRKINNQDLVMTKQQFNINKHLVKKNQSGVGIPQGAPISSVLANIYMIDFDKLLKTYVAGHSGTYMRYSDDFIIIIPYENDEDVENYIDNIKSFIDITNGLVKLKEDKTGLYIYKSNKILSYPSMEKSALDYLGFIFDGNGIKIRPRAITKYYYRMRRKAGNFAKLKKLSCNGKRIIPRNLYNIYSVNSKKQTFISYAMKAEYQLGLHDPEAASLIKNYKQKISAAIKEAKKKMEGQDRISG